MSPVRSFVALLFLGVAFAQRVDDGADLVILGKVVSLDPKVPVAEAVVIRAGQIERLSSLEGARARIGARTRVLHVPKGGVAMPGFVESHGHLRALGKTERTLDLSDATSVDDVVKRVAAASAAVPEGRWIVGRGWNHERFADPVMPTAADLDRATSKHPVALYRTDGHALATNSAALAAARISDKTPNVAGGEVLKAADGRPTGILVDRAMDVVTAIADADPAPELLVADLKAAAKRCLEHGVTTFVDAGTTPTELLRLAALVDSGEFAVRVHALLHASTPDELAAATARPPILDLSNGRLSVRGLKISADGALGSRGAALNAPYDDRPGSTGLVLAPLPHLLTAARKALAEGWQLCVHAIGDRANGMVLDAIEAALAERPVADHRFRIEHAQVVSPKDLGRFAKLGVIASIQPCHATSDGPWAPKRLGAARYAEMGYPARSLLDAGARITLGTDTPVEPLSPIRNIVAAITRWDPDGVLGGPFKAEERLNRFEAVAGVTTWGAYATFAEKRRGVLKPGMDADVVILEADPLTATPASLMRAKVVATIVAGKVAFERTP
jgi:predicted amidohydrolase YtcJ